MTSCTKCKGGSGPFEVECHECEGTGCFYEDEKLKQCELCNGTQLIIVEECPECGSDGDDDDYDDLDNL